MAKRSVELQIQLNNAKSIGELETVLKEINAELKQVDANSEAFIDLSNASKQADASLKSVKDDLKNISDEKQIDSVAKLGGSLAAGLSVATLAATKFGEETQAGVQKAIQTATELNVVVGSIKPILEGLSSTNRKAFGEFVNGFRTSGIAAKLFGTTTASAIAATGIGLLIVALGLIVANFDDVKKAVINFGNSIPFIKVIIDGIQSLIDKVGSLSNLFSGLGAFIKGIFTVGANAVDEFNKAIEKGKVIEALEAQTKEIQEQNVERERAVRILEAQGKKEQEINDIKKQSASLELKNLQDLQEAGKELTDDQKKRIEDLKAEVQILEIRGEKIVEQAKREAFNRANAEAELQMNRKALDEAALKDQADRAKTAQDKLNAELIEKYKEEKLSESEIDKIVLESQSEREISERVFTLEKERALVDNANAVKLLKEKEFQRKVLDERIKALEETTNRTDEQEQVLRDLRTQRFKETIDQIMPFIQVGMDAINQISQAIDQGFQRELQNISTQLNIINTQYQESVSTRMAYEAQLQTAQGAQRDELLNSIDEESKKQANLANQRKKLQNDQIKAQNKQQEVQWLNSIINSIVQTALAVVEALPNIPLAIAVGALGAIQTGVIAGNKPVPVPTFASGGYTSGLGYMDSTGHEVAGVVHANEYVVPDRIMNTAMGSSLVDSLEAMRLGMPSFADGGFVPAPTTTANAGSGLDPSTFKSILESAKIYVAVTEVRDRLTNVQVIENRAAA